VHSKYADSCFSLLLGSCLRPCFFADGMVKMEQNQGMASMLCITLWKSNAMLCFRWSVNALVQYSCLKIIPWKKFSMSFCLHVRLVPNCDFIVQLIELTVPSFKFQASLSNIMDEPVSTN
jgi:hypothetical protein